MRKYLSLLLAASLVACSKETPKEVEVTFNLGVQSGPMTRAGNEGVYEALSITAPPAPFYLDARSTEDNSLSYSMVTGEPLTMTVGEYEVWGSGYGNTIEKANNGTLYYWPYWEVDEMVDVSVDARRARELIGVCQQNLALDVDISIRENIISKGVLHRIPRKELEARMMELSDVIGLTPFLDKLPRDLSGGWKRKTVILCALIHKPSILFLDEPTAGLDTQSRHMLWDIIRILNKRGTTVFITTHYMDEAESLCDRVSIITKGKIRATGTPRELCEKFGSFTVEYNAEDGKRLVKFFHTREEAKQFYAEKESEGAVLRGTHLEDVFLEYSGKIDVSRIEEVMG